MGERERSIEKHCHTDGFNHEILFCTGGGGGGGGEGKGSKNNILVKYIIGQMAPTNSTVRTKKIDHYNKITNLMVENVLIT